jgi:glycosyltransferase involved in cell wall biosynthesis
MRVLFVTSEWPTPDVPNAVPYLVRQIDFLRRAGIEVDVFAFRGRRHIGNYLRAWKRLRRTLRETRFDLVHAHWGQSAVLAFPRRAPLVVTFHGCDLNGVKGDNNRTTLRGRLLQMLCRLVSRRANAVIVVSAKLKRHLPESVQASILPLGLDLSTIPLIPRQEARRQCGLPPSERLVLFVGSPEDPVKRFSLARQAVKKLAQTLPCKLILGWDMPNSRILQLMNACDALLLTSIQEGSPTVVKEALACNLPVVSVDVGDVASRIAGVSGCHVCQDDRPETIARVLAEVLRLPQRVEGRSAVADLDEASLTEKLIAIYTSVVPKPLSWPEVRSVNRQTSNRVNLAN